MAERIVGVTDTASGAGVADVRGRERSVGGNTAVEQYVIPIDEFVTGYQTSYRGMVTTFRTIGLASANHNLFTIWNKTGSTKLIAVRRLSFLTDATGALATVAPVVQVSRITALPTGGTVLTPVAFDTALTHDTNCEAMGATASDGGAATTITSTAGTRAWADLKMRLHTAVGQVLFPDEYLIPQFCDREPIILRAAEGLQVQMVQAALTTDHYVVSCAFDELVAVT